MGILITKIANRWFIKGAYFKIGMRKLLLKVTFKKINIIFVFVGRLFNIGSVSLNALAGKIMFRDFVYITYDYSVRVQDGYFIFRWWRSYVPKDVSEG